MAEPRHNALYPRQSDALVENWAAGTRPETLSAYQEPWYRALPNYLTGLVHGPDSTMAQANSMRHLAGTENPLNLPGQFSEGLDTAAQGYKLGNPTMTGAGLFGVMSSLPIPGFKGAGQAAKQEAKGIRAYHGSPHDFDKFDTSKIGTGEGAQAYGHGLYFAESEGVAKSYRDGLGGKTPYVGGARYNPDDPLHMASNMMKTFGGDKKRAIAYLDRPTNQSKTEQEARKILASNSEIPTFSSTPSGRMYEVKINADPEHFLDWDKPLSQQSAYDKLYEYARNDGKYADDIMQILEDATDKTHPNYGLTGDHFHDIMKASIGEKQAPISNALKEAGIPGIKYLDQGSRTAGDGSRNYVVFDAATIEILRKYGLLPPMLAAGAAGAGSNALYDGINNQ